MKRFLLSMALVLIFATSLFATNYYGCGAGAINGDTTWCAVGDVTAGVCAKDSGSYVSGATAVQAGNTLYANGCTITIPSGTFTATKISTKGDGSKGAGGGFTVLVNGVTATIDANIEGGTTDCLTIGSTTNTIVVNILTTSGGGTITTDATAGADGIYISGSAATVNIGKSGSPVTITGGGAANNAVNDTSTVTTKTVYANATGGTSLGATAYNLNSVSGTLILYGNMTGSNTSYNAPGFGINSGNTITITGNCIGGVSAMGCNLTSGTTTIVGDCIAGTVVGCVTSGSGILIATGNIVSSTTVLGASGRVRWQPSNAKKYIKFDGGGTPIYASAYLASDSGGTKITPGNTAAQIAIGAYFIKSDDYDGSTLTQGTKSGGGGGAWGF